jgi:molecular chaperone DnaK
VDANGILHVSAKDKGTNKEQKIRIEASSGLTDAEIAKMREEAKANEAADKAEREKIEKINGADSLIFSTEKQLKEFGDKLSAGNKSAIETALAELKTAHQSQDLSGIDSAMEKLNGAWQAASQEMYAQGGEGQPGAAPGGNPGNAGASDNGGATDDVTDVNFEEVK